MKKELIKHYAKALNNKYESIPIDLSQKVKINFNFQIHKINDLVREFNGNMPPNKFPHHVLAIISKGKGQKQISSIKFNIEKNMIFYIGKDSIHSSYDWLLDTEGYMLSFSDSFFIENNIRVPNSKISLLSNKYVNPYKVLDKVTAADILNIFESIFFEYSKIDICYTKEITTVKVIELLFKYLRIFNLRDNSTNNYIYNNFLTLLEGNFHKEKLVKYYADQLNTHPSYLNYIIKSKTGESVKKIIRNRIIIEAKYLLFNTELSIKEISFKLGFSDQNTFSRYFKNAEGIPLIEYRKIYS